MLRCTFLGWRTASIPNTSTEPASGTTSVETTRTSVLFPLPLGPRIPTTSPRPTASVTESSALTTSARRFLKLFSTFFSSRAFTYQRSEEHTSELQSRQYLVCRLLLEKKKKGT